MIYITRINCILISSKCNIENKSALTRTIAAAVARFTIYFASVSTRISLCIAAVMHAAYGAAHGAWGNPVLIGVTAFIACFMPLYSRLSNRIETWGRLGRFTPQLLFNVVVLGVVALGAP